VQIAQIALGKHADRAVPYLTTLFVYLLTVNLLGLVYLLTVNLLGLVPLLEISGAIGLTGWGGKDANQNWLNVTPIGGTPTSGVWVGAAFSAMTFLLLMLSGYVGQVYALWRKATPEQRAAHEAHKPVDAGANFWLDWSQRISSRTWPLPIAVVGGVWTWLNSFVPPVPGLAGMIMWPVLLFLELLGYIAKCFALCVRLVANMSSGHLLLAVILGFAQTAEGLSSIYVGVPASLGVVALMMLELAVALLQAYIFTFLSALFIGLAAGPQH